MSERALKTINFREEQEKLNVWVARLNLENLYGSRETLMNKFEEACKLNDAKKMHMQLLAIFEKNGEAQVTEHFFKTLTRKFRSSCKVRFSPLFITLPRSLAPPTGGVTLPYSRQLNVQMAISTYTSGSNKCSHVYRFGFDIASSNWVDNIPKQDRECLTAPLKPFPSASTSSSFQRSPTLTLPSTRKECQAQKSPS